MANPGSGELKLALRGEDDIVRARHEARDQSKSLGFGLVDQSRIATAVSELTRNVIRYATNSQGEVMIRRLEWPGRIGIEIVVTDEGPGIDDLHLAMSEGFTTGRGMGLGLSGTRRLMDEMEIETGPGRGTTIVVRKWRR